MEDRRTPAEKKYFIGNCYNEFQESQDGFTLMKTLIANYILEGIYFYSGFMFFYNLSRNGKCQVPHKKSDISIEMKTRICGYSATLFWN